MRASSIEHRLEGIPGCVGIGCVHLEDQHNVHEILHPGLFPIFPRKGERVNLFGKVLGERDRSEPSGNNPCKAQRVALSNLFRWCNQWRYGTDIDLEVFEGTFIQECPNVEPIGLSAWFLLDPFSFRRDTKDDEVVQLVSCGRLQTCCDPRWSRGNNIGRDGKINCEVEVFRGAGSIPKSKIQGECPFQEPGAVRWRLKTSQKPLECDALSESLYRHSIGGTALPDAFLQGHPEACRIGVSHQAAFRARVSA